MNSALRGAEESRSELYAFCAKHEGRRDAPSVRDSARGDDRYLNRVDYLRHESHRRELTDVTSGLLSLGDDGESSELFHPDSHRDRRDDRYHLDPGVQPHGHELRRHSGSGRDDLYFFLDEYRRGLLGGRALEHKVYADGLVREFSRFSDLTSEVVAARHRGNYAESATVRYGGGELTVGDPRHSALEYRVLYSEPVCYSRFYHLFIMTIPLVQSCSFEAVLKDGLYVLQNSRPYVVKDSKLSCLKIYFQT